MSASRLLVLVLLLGIGAGPTLLDRCLFGCSDEGSAQSEVSPCHQESAPTDVLSVHGAHACGHDHESLLADAFQNVRVGISRELDVSGPLYSALPTESSGRVSALATPGTDPPPQPRPARILQLRL